MAFIAWPEIEGFHNVRKFIRVDPGEWWRAKEQLNGSSVVEYRAKVKLHGTNAAVQVNQDGTVVAQSRTNIITPESDNAGFARWVMSNKDAWVGRLGTATDFPGFIIYGEWCGPGIQKGVAISEIPKKVFAVFAARPLDEDGTPQDDILWVEPHLLKRMVAGIPDTYVLPWYERMSEQLFDSVADDPHPILLQAKLKIDWRQSDEELTRSTSVINKWVEEVEANDPWVKETFNVDGTGEGLVFYPVSEAHLGWESFQNLTFKAKGEKHKNIKTAAPAQVNPEVAASIDAFVELVLTPARLEQGATSVGGFDMKLTGKFVNWCVGDVQKETQDELEASGLDWKQVEKPLTNKARSWYIEQAKVR